MNGLTTIAALPSAAGARCALTAEPAFTPFSTITAIGSEAPAVPVPNPAALRHMAAQLQRARRRNGRP